MTRTSESRESDSTFFGGVFRVVVWLASLGGASLFYLDGAAVAVITPACSRDCGSRCSGMEPDRSTRWRIEELKIQKLSGNLAMIGRVTGLPERSEAAPYYFRYIDRIASGDIIGVLETQLEEMSTLLAGISEEKSLHRYAPGKWSIRQVLNHVNDTERVFVSRAFWFARGFDTPLPSYDQEVSAAVARADDVSWASHVEEFRAVRLATLAFFRNLPVEAWMRGGIASGNPFTVRALAYITAGHASHHEAVLKDRYLSLRVPSPTSRSTP